MLVNHLIQVTLHSNNLSKLKRHHIGQTSHQGSIKRKTLNPHAGSRLRDIQDKQNARSDFYPTEEPRNIREKSKARKSNSRQGIQLKEITVKENNHLKDETIS